MMYDKDAGYYSTLCGNVPVGEGRFWRLNINHPQHKDSEGNIRFTHQCTAIKTAEDVWIGQKFQLAQVGDTCNHLLKEKTAGSHDKYKTDKLWRHLSAVHGIHSDSKAEERSSPLDPMDDLLTLPMGKYFQKLEKSGDFGMRLAGRPLHRQAASSCCFR